MMVQATISEKSTGKPVIGFMADSKGIPIEQQAYLILACMDFQKVNDFNHMYTVMLSAIKQDAMFKETMAKFAIKSDETFSKLSSDEPLSINELLGG